MKWILVVLALALPMSAHAQVGPEVYKPVTFSQLVSVQANATQSTGAFLHNMAQFICSISCFIYINITGQTLQPTTVSGTYLPADVPTIFSVPINGKVSVIRSTNNGQLYIQELSK